MHHIDAPHQITAFQQLLILTGLLIKKSVFCHTNKYILHQKRVFFRQFIQIGMILDHTQQSGAPFQTIVTLQKALIMTLINSKPLFYIKILDTGIISA